MNVDVGDTTLHNSTFNIRCSKFTRLSQRFFCKDNSLPSSEYPSWFQPHPDISQEAKMALEIKKTVSFDLEDRLIDFAVSVVRYAEAIQSTKSCGHLASQLMRCGTSPALNYGEAQSAESRSDFIHKLRIILKELRETRIAITIVARTSPGEGEHDSSLLIAECDQLISIFVKSLRTAEANRAREK